MPHSNYLLAPFLALCIASVPLADADAQRHTDTTTYYNYTMGPDCTVKWGTEPPEVSWDGEPAPGQLFVTASGLGYVVDGTGAPKLVLDWRDGGGDLEDRAYCGASFFAWALEQVRGGAPFDPQEWRRRDRREESPRTDRGGVLETWTGERVVELSNPGHELRFEITPAGATATDNGEPIEVTGADGNYRVYAEDYECGVSVRADGYVYHYYRPR